MEAYKRIEKLIEYLNLNKNSFSREIGYTQNTTIGRIINEKRTPSEKTLKKIVDRFPKVNYDWLLTGKGEMLNREFVEQETKFIGKEKKIDIEDIIDVFFLYQDDFENNKRFKRYLESVRKDAIIEYQHNLLTEGKNKE